MSAISSTRPTWAELSRAALRKNYRLLRQQAVRAGAEAVAVIKANAYGHGAAEALSTLPAEECSWFAVTCLDEARVLLLERNDCRMLLLSGIFAGEAEEVLRYGLTPVLGAPDQLRELADVSSRLSKDRADASPFRFHLEIDTGMARQGIQWNDDAALAACAALLAQHPQLQLEAAMTHFASPEDAASTQTAEQLDRFRTALATLRRHGVAPPLLHAGNSATLFASAQMDSLGAIASESCSRLLLRPGIALYGCGIAAGSSTPTREMPYGPEAARRGFEPVLAWKTRIAALRDIPAGEPVSYNATFRAARPTRIALVPIGYADGYNRLLSNRGHVLVRGLRAPIAGRVTMDQTMLDVTGIPGAAVGDEVVLLGRQGDDRITADDLAALTGTIAYEVLCAIGPRVPRVWQ